MFNAPEGKDEGIYQCFADNGYGVSASVKCNLREAKLASFAIEEARVRHFVIITKARLCNIRIFLWVKNLKFH